MLGSLHREQVISLLINGISYLFILLFIYAALSKALDFGNFSLQLGQSPLLSAYAGMFAWSVPIIEIIIAGLLFIPRYRPLGLYFSFILMCMFTTYILFILNFADYVPCSCGGVLEKMGWSEHLIFNVFFMLLAILGIVLSKNEKTGFRYNYIRIDLLLSTTLIGSISLITLLFILSDDVIHNRNNFIRKFPPHAAILESELNLKQNSYYITGIDNNTIYLGNFTALRYIKALNFTLKTILVDSLSISNMELPFRAPSVRIVPPEFYFIDGSVPVIFTGTIKEWKADIENHSKAFFSLIAPINSKKFAIRARDSKTNENILGILKIGDSAAIKLSRNLLVKQIDGIFDTDGMLLYNKQLKHIIYTYYYRNQFIVTSDDLKLNYVGQTIDTVNKAQIRIHTNKANGSQMAAPPLLVNKNTATYGNYLFIQSGLIGRFERRETWRKASVIDVYDLIKKQYVLSFYIPKKEKKQLSEFQVYGNKLICITGNYIQVYNLESKFFL